MTQENVANKCINTNGLSSCVSVYLMYRFMPQSQKLFHFYLLREEVNAIPFIVNAIPFIPATDSILKAHHLFLELFNSKHFCQMCSLF